MDNRTTYRERSAADRKKRKNKRFTSKMQANLLLVFCVVILIFIALAVRLWYISNENGEKYEKRVLSQQTYVSNAIPFKRGDITDRNGTKLAVSEKVYNLILDPVTILEREDYKEPTLKAVNQVFSIPMEELEQILVEKKDSRYVQMKKYKHLDYSVVEQFEKLKVKDKSKKDDNTDSTNNIHGVWFEEEYVRTYPLNNVGSSIIGFTQKNDGNVGSWGIEEYYNEELNGTNGREYGYFNADLELERNVKPAINGNTIVSTIDANVQAITEKYVEKFLEETGAKNIAVMITNPNNGEIYASVSNQTFDLNNPRDLSVLYTEEELAEMTIEEKSASLSALWRNFCISDAFEPGSTFKPFTVAAALEEDKANENSTYVCDGSEVVVEGQRPVKCSSRQGHGTITLEQSLMFSCNDALMAIGKTLGREDFAAYTRLFGFGEKTGIDLPGESQGIIFSKEQLNPMELATSSFGQSQTVNMSQMVAAFASLINGGKYYKPHIVKEIQNDAGAVVEKVDGVLVRETVSADTSSKIRQYLKETVEAGTAALAGVEGYSIGGKTGTAEKAPRDKSNYIVSFLGFAPTDDPQMIIYVVIDEPDVEDQAHSSYATQLAHEILEEVLPFLGVYPSK
ncbi:MAG: peptidoglycan D,D-transpeptidase FtsI family protein [Acetivibrio ethanolgignens]